MMDNADSLDRNHKELQFQVDFYCYTCGKNFSSSTAFDEHEHEEDDDNDSGHLNEEEDRNHRFSHNNGEFKYEEGNSGAYEDIEIKAEVDESWYDEKEESDEFQDSGNSNIQFHMSSNSCWSEDTESQNPLAIPQHEDEEVEDKTTGIMRRSYNKEMAACELCGIHLKKQSLGKHMLTHGNIRAFSCDLCLVSFKRHCDLLRHMRNVHKRSVSNVLKLPSPKHQTSTSSSYLPNSVFVPDKLNNFSNNFNMNIMNTTLQPKSFYSTAPTSTTPKLKLSSISNNNSNNIPFNVQHKPTMVSRSSPPSTASTIFPSSSSSTQFTSSQLHPATIISNPALQQLIAPSLFFLVQNKKEIRRQKREEELVRKEQRQEEKLRKKKLQEEKKLYRNCKICGLILKKESLVKHMSCHSKEKAYPCSICEVRFSRHFDMLRHIRTHHNISEIYKCDKCDGGASFGLFHAYRSHMEEVHGEIIKKTRARQSKREILRTNEDSLLDADTNNESSHESFTIQEGEQIDSVPLKCGRPSKYSNDSNKNNISNMCVQRIHPKESSSSSTTTTSTSLLTSPSPAVLLLCTSTFAKPTSKTTADSGNDENILLNCSKPASSYEDKSNKKSDIVHEEEKDIKVQNASLEMNQNYNCDNSCSSNSSNSKIFIDKSATKNEMNDVYEEEEDLEEYEFDFKCNKCNVDIDSLKKLNAHIKKHHLKKKTNTKL